MNDALNFLHNLDNMLNGLQQYEKSHFEHFAYKCPAAFVLWGMGEEGTNGSGRQYGAFPIEYAGV